MEYEYANQVFGNWSEDSIMTVVSGILRASSLSPGLCKMIGSDSFCRRISRLLRSVDKLINNAGHNCLPPDYYSDEMNIMFDVMRVNDAERRKGYNPVMLDLQSVKVHYVPGRSGLEYHVIDLSSDCDMDLNFDKVHQFQYYKKHSSRVITNHVQKLPIWKQEHPVISRKGFVVMDDAGLYFKGHADLLDKSKDLWNFHFEYPIQVYEPWRDKKLIGPLIMSDLDFLVWCNPLANMSRANRAVLQGRYPAVVIVDLRHSVDNLIEYDVADDWFSTGFEI